MCYTPGFSPHTFHTAPNLSTHTFVSHLDLPATAFHTSIYANFGESVGELLVVYAYDGWNRSLDLVLVDSNIPCFTIIFFKCHRPFHFPIVGTAISHLGDSFNTSV